jgi:hypothetical protein
VGGAGKRYENGQAREPTVDGSSPTPHSDRITRYRLHSRNQQSPRPANDLTFSGLLPSASEEQIRCSVGLGGRSQILGTLASLWERDFLHGAMGVIDDKPW